MQLFFFGVWMYFLAGRNLPIMPSELTLIAYKTFIMLNDITFNNRG